MLRTFDLVLSWGRFLLARPSLLLSPYKDWELKLY